MFLISLKTVVDKILDVMKLLFKEVCSRGNLQCFLCKYLIIVVTRQCNLNVSECSEKKKQNILNFFYKFI